MRELKAYDKYYQRFKIDDHLDRQERALENLHAAGESSRFGRCTCQPRLSVMIQDLSTLTKLYDTLFATSYSTVLSGCTWPTGSRSR